MFKTLKIVAVLMVTLACVVVTVAFLFGPGISRYRPHPIRRYPAETQSREDKSLPDSKYEKSHLEGTGPVTTDRSRES